jgi:hypothetical protein
MKYDECFLEGVTDCDPTGTCEKCIRDEAAWLDSWYRWNDSRATEKEVGELAPAAPVHRWGVAKVRNKVERQ